MKHSLFFILSLVLFWSPGATPQPAKIVFTDITAAAGSVESLEMAARLKPDQAHVHYQLGRAYIAAGRQAEGESQLEISKDLKEKARAKN